MSDFTTARRVLDYYDRVANRFTTVCVLVGLLAAVMFFADGMAIFSGFLLIGLLGYSGITWFGHRKARKLIMTTNISEISKKYPEFRGEIFLNAYDLFKNYMTDDLNIERTWNDFGMVFLEVRGEDWNEIVAVKDFDKTIAN